MIVYWGVRLSDSDYVFTRCTVFSFTEFSLHVTVITVNIQHMLYLEETTACEVQRGECMYEYKNNDCGMP